MLLGFLHPTLKDMKSILGGEFSWASPDIIPFLEASTI
jgi:hypothetical protein